MEGTIGYRIWNLGSGGVRIQKTLPSAWVCHNREGETKSPKSKKATHDKRRQWAVPKSRRKCNSRRIKTSDTSEGRKFYLVLPRLTTSMCISCGRFKKSMSNCHPFNCIAFKRLWREEIRQVKVMTCRILRGKGYPFGTKKKNSCPSRVCSQLGGDSRVGRLGRSRSQIKTSPKIK